MMTCWIRDGVLYIGAILMMAGGARAGEHAVAGASKQPPLDVPLTVYETGGVDRHQDICSTGVPLPCGLLREPAGMAVFDASGIAVPAQFRVLERWRDAGEGQGDLSIRWLLVTFLADVPAGGQRQYHLRRGDNPPPAKPVQLEDKGGTWSLGDLRIPKDFAGPFQLVFTDSSDRKITAAELPVSWSVWESGPLRACLKAESPTVPGKFGFVAWLYAYAGQSRWDLTLVLKNTPNEPQGPLYFKDFSVVWEPAATAGAADYLLGTAWGRPCAGRLDGEQCVYLHQESDGTDHWNTFGHDGHLSPVLDWTADKSKTKAALPAFRGYRVMAGSQQLAAGNFAAGWAVLNGQYGGAFAGVRDYYQQYPKATEVAPGRIVLRLWPKYTGSFGGLHWLDDCTRKWHDLSFRLSPRPLTASEAEAYSRALDFPLLAHPPAAWYYAAGALRPQPEHAADKPYGGGAAQVQQGSGRNWVNFGGDVTDQIRRRYHGADLGGFARSGDPSQAYQLYNVGRHSSGLTPLWLDDYRYPRDVDKLTHAQYCGLARNAGTYRAGTWHHGYLTWNDAHFCCQEVFDNWRLFGDPLAFEALTTIGRWCQAYVDFRETHPEQLVAGTRADGLPLHNLCEAYRILGDESMRRSLDRFADVCWRQVNKQRGNYGIMDSWEGGKEACEKPFMMAQVIKGLRSYWELTGSERTADQIYGMADFILDESSLGPWGFNYVVLIDADKNRVFRATKRAEAEQDARHVSYGDLAWVLAWVHRHYGDERFRTMIDGIDAQAYPYVRRGYTNYYPERPDQTPPAAVHDLTAEALGDGKVRLSWTAPAGDPARYQLKWAERPIVERLRWPEEKDSQANWWAAGLVAGGPRPAAAGTRESLVVQGIPPGKKYWAIRAFDAASNRSPISNLAVIDVR